MEKKVRIFDYQDEPMEITIKGFENVKEFVFEIISGDGILTVIYNDNHKEYFDSSDCRCMAFANGIWFISPENIDILNRMKSHYDTDELCEKKDIL